MSDIIPIMDKNTIKYITQNITPEEAEYVQGIKSTLDDTKADEKTCDDIIYITKLLAFQTKFKTLKWTLTATYKEQINEFSWIIQDYIDNALNIIQSIIGEIKGSDITKIELPVSDNPLEIINELKICVQNWLTCHDDNIEYRGLINITETFLAQIHKYIYLFRLSKVSAKDYNENIQLPNKTDLLISPEDVIQF